MRGSHLQVLISLFYEYRYRIVLIEQGDLAKIAIGI
jgi:hypothetical protein